MSTIAYSDSLILTETNYFKREFGIKIVSVGSASDFIDKLDNVNSSTLLIASTNPEFWVEILNKCEKYNVIFFLLGNENFEPAVFNALNKINSLLHVFVFNPPNQISNIAVMGGVIGNLFDGGLRKTKAVGSVYRDGRISYSLKNKFKKINMEYSFSSLPLGYSNSFANKITKLAKLTDTDSLIERESIMKINALKKIIYKFSFVGQTGNRRRETYLRAAQEFDNVKIYPPEKEFGGNNVGDDYTYINSLLNSKYILVPPGNLSNLNHRYTESLICHSLPVILANNSLDSSRNDHWTNNLSFLRRYSVKSQMNYLENISDETFENYYTQASFDDFKKIFDAKKLIFNLIGNIDHNHSVDLLGKSTILSVDQGIEQRNKL